MPSRCVVAGCSKTTKDDGVSLHLFPRGENVRRMWIAKVKLTRAKWSGPSESSVMCSAHFKEDDFDSGLHSQFAIARKRTLKSSAVPTIQLGAGPSSEKKPPRRADPRAAAKRERMRVSRPCMHLGLAAPRGGGGGGRQGGNCPPYHDFEGKKRRRGEKKKREKKERKKKAGKKKKKGKKGKKERQDKQTNKQKTRLWHFACKITPFSYTNFQKFSLSDGSPLGRFAPSL